VAARVAVTCSRPLWWPWDCTVPRGPSGAQDKGRPRRHGSGEKVRRSGIWHAQKETQTAARNARAPFPQGVADGDLDDAGAYCNEGGGTFLVAGSRQDCVFGHSLIHLVMIHTWSWRQGDPRGARTRAGASRGQREDSVHASGDVTMAAGTVMAAGTATTHRSSSHMRTAIGHRARGSGREDRAPGLTGWHGGDAARKPV
jgi:hypothetical protein